MNLIYNFLDVEHVHSHQHSCYQKYACLCDKNSIAPETFHRNWCFADQMSLAKCSHENTICDKRNDTRHFDNSELHDHVDGVTKNNHDGHNKDTVIADSL